MCLLSLSLPGRNLRPYVWSWSRWWLSCLFSCFLIDVVCSFWVFGGVRVFRSYSCGGGAGFRREESFCDNLGGNFNFL